MCCFSFRLVCCFHIVIFAYFGYACTFNLRQDPKKRKTLFSCLHVLLSQLGYSSLYSYGKGMGGNAFTTYTHMRNRKKKQNAYSAMNRNDLSVDVAFITNYFSRLFPSLIFIRKHNTYVFRVCYCCCFSTFLAILVVSPIFHYFSTSIGMKYTASKKFGAPAHF